MDYDYMKCIRHGLFGMLTVFILAAFMAPTAFAGNNGTARFSIVGTVSLTVPTDSINFGSGSPAVGVGSTIASNATDNPSNWTDNPGGFVVENDGNVEIAVKVYADKNAADFIGGTGPTFKFVSSNNETGACTGTLATSWTEMTKALGTAGNVCTILGFADSVDSVKVDLQLFIPADAPVKGNSESIVTFTAKQAGT
jgi:hypothetical protein